MARHTILVSAVLLIAPQITWSGDGISDELRRCSLIEDAPARLDCYDKITTEQVAEKPPIPVAAKPLPAKTLDDLGSKTLGHDDGEELQVRAVVTKCTKNQQNKYYFHFESGQIWKQTSDKRVNLKDCEFDVTITQDFFGYKMRREGEKRYIRISRVK